MVESSSLLMRERKGVSTLLTRNPTAASARLKRVVVSAGLGPSQLNQLAREPIGLQRVVVFPDSDPGRATIVRRRFCSWKESSSRTRVEHLTLVSRGKQLRSLRSVGRASAKHPDALLHPQPPVVTLFWRRCNFLRR